MKKFIALSLTALFALPLCAQKKIKGNGSITTINRTTKTYEAISVSHFFDIELVEGLEGQLILEGETNILENIKTEVVDGVLVIKPKTKSALKPSRQIGVHIIVPVEAISSIALSGSGNLVGLKLLKVDKLNISVSGDRKVDLNIDAKIVEAYASGSGKIKLSGQAEELYASLSGDGNLNSYEMTAQKATIGASGSSRARVVASELLSASASGNGHIWHKGNPVKLNSNISGSGKIKISSE